MVEEKRRKNLWHFYNGPSCTTSLFVYWKEVQVFNFAFILQIKLLNSLSLVLQAIWKIPMSKCKFWITPIYILECIPSLEERFFKKKDDTYFLVLKQNMLVTSYSSTLFKYQVIYYILTLCFSPLLLITLLLYKEFLLL